MSAQHPYRSPLIRPESGQLKVNFLERFDQHFITFALLADQAISHLVFNTTGIDTKQESGDKVQWQANYLLTAPGYARNGFTFALFCQNRVKIGMAQLWQPDNI